MDIKNAAFGLSLARIGEAKMDADRDEARAQGAAEERARIVAYLRGCHGCGRDCHDMADAIERQENER